MGKNIRSDSERISLPSKISKIIVEGELAGYFDIEEDSDGLLLSGIYIEKSFRNKGLGTEVLSDLISEAQRRSMDMRLQVLKPNPTFRLYKKLGFEVVSETDTHYKLLLKSK